MNVPADFAGVFGIVKFSLIFGMAEFALGHPDASGAVAEAEIRGREIPGAVGTHAENGSEEDGFNAATTTLGFAGIGPAVIVHEGSTLLVLFNSLRLMT